MWRNQKRQPERIRQIKNFMTITILAIGTPMLLMGDEAQRTQVGNNNAYCQNNEISWFDWSLLERHSEIFRFVQHVIRLRGVFAAEYSYIRSAPPFHVWMVPSSASLMIASSEDSTTRTGGVRQCSRERLFHSGFWH